MKQLLVSFVLGVFALPAAVASPDAEKLYTAKTCVACHGPKGDKALLPNYPKINGQNAPYAEQQMKDIKSGARANAQSPAMKGIMHLVSDEEIKALAVWLEKLK